LTKIN